LFALERALVRRRRVMTLVRFFANLTRIAMATRTVGERASQFLRDACLASWRFLPIH
jgi:hypothetical protein